MQMIHNQAMSSLLYKLDLVDVIGTVIGVGGRGSVMSNGQ